MSRCLLWLTGFWVVSIGKAFSVEIPMDLVSWTYSARHLECRLEYKLPQYGKFYFRSNKKNELIFNAELKKYSKNWNNGSLFSQPAPWNNKSKLELISDSALVDSNKISFIHNVETLLDKISSGNWVKLTLGGNNTSAQEEYIIPIVHFHKSLAKFKHCKEALPEISFSEARDAFIYFKSGQRVLTNDQRKHIDSLYRYLLIDKRIRKVLVDGYTDSTGDSITNLKISRLRATQVADELIKLGISEEKIEVRAHGSRYPVISNATKAGRQKNRRVTIRLVRDNEKVVPAKK